MRRNSICPECRSENILFQEVYKKWPIIYRIISVGMGLIMFSGAVGLITDQLSLIWRAIAFVMSLLLLSAGIFAKNGTLTSVRFKCQDCQHEFVIEDPQFKHARKWKALSSPNWKEATEEILPPFAR